MSGQLRAEMMVQQTDLAVIGAGPAGLAAAITAAGHGASVTLLDEQASPGGQIYRNLEQRLAPGASDATASIGRILGDEYLAGADLLEQLRTHRDALCYEPGAVVWQLDSDGRLSWSRAGQARQLQCRHIIIATGALERPVPVPGWTLPGVMTVGAAQILLKSSALIPANAVLAGSGPLLYLFARQMIDAKTPPLALVETQGHADYLRALAQLPSALKGWRILREGLRLLKSIRAAGIPRYTGASNVELHGDGVVSGLSFRHGNTVQELACDTVLLHQGVVPNTQMTRSLGLVHHWSVQQRCFYPQCSAWGETSLDTISVAGDGAGILGAGAAALSGKKAALHALYRLELVSKEERNSQAARFAIVLARQSAPRRFLDVLYPPPVEVLRPADDVLVCRCEEVTAGDIRRYAGLGCVGPNQTKAFGRCGMGPCQGRYCGLTVTEILAAENKMSPAEVGAYRIRSPIKPITLGELASLSGANSPAG